MVELESENETTRLSNKIAVLNKNIKALIVSINSLMEKLDEPVEKTPEKEKERVGKILESRGVGRPKGDHNSKRDQYLKMFNEQRINSLRLLHFSITTLKRMVINMYCFRVFTKLS